MSFTPGSVRSWFPAALWPSKQQIDRLLIRVQLLDKRILLVIAFLLTFCLGLAAGLAWQLSSGRIASIPQTGPAPAAQSPNLEQQVEAMLLGLAVVRQRVDELGAGLGEIRRDITNLQTSEQAILDKISEPPARPAGAPAPKPVQRPSPASPTR